MSARRWLHQEELQLVALGCLGIGDCLERQNKRAGRRAAEPRKPRGRQQLSGLDNLLVLVQVNDVEGGNAGDGRKIGDTGQPQAGGFVVRKALDHDAQHSEGLKGRVNEGYGLSEGMVPGLIYEAEFLRIHMSSLPGLMAEGPREL